MKGHVSNPGELYPSTGYSLGRKDIEALVPFPYEP
jgi:hypothetical protein